MKKNAAKDKQDAAEDAAAETADGAASAATATAGKPAEDGGNGQAGGGDSGGNGSAAGEAPGSSGASVSSDASGRSEGSASSDASAPPEAQPAKRSPAEAFMALSDEVAHMSAELADVGSFMRACRDKLIRQADQYRLEGMQEVLDSMMRLHGLVFRRLISMEAGDARPDHFTISFFETLEAELAQHDVEVVRPQPGDDVDLEIMTTIGAVKCPFWRKPDKVAQVASCGFALNMESGRRILRKAEVTVYRR